MDSENFGFSYKEIVLETLCQFNDNSYFFIELFSNFDCDINDKNILKELLSLICKIIRKHYYKPKYDATFLENERTILSTNCFNFLIDFVKNLDKFVTEKSNICINEIHYNYTRTKIEEEEKEARDSLIFKEKITQNRKIKSIIEKGVEKFNLKPSKGIDFLRKNEILPSNIIFEKLKTNDINNEPTLLNYSILYDKTFLSNCDYEDFLAKEISKFLKNNRELKKTKVGEYLCSSNSLNKKCLFYYIELFNFKDLHILEAMRIFFSDFYLIGEGQIVDRIMQHFGQKYHKDNPNLLSNPDIGYYLSFSIIMLQTDLHRPEIVTKMTAQTFCQRIVQLTKCEMSNEFLVDIYNKIQNDPIRVAGMDDNFRIMIKKKKDFDYHNEKVFRSTIDELKKMNPTVVFFTNIDNYHVRNLLESCWSFFLGIFSVYVNIY
jgi:Sec7-like guanine-nucleotide exchange factor